MEPEPWNEPVQLPSGGELRTSGPVDADALVLLVGGGTQLSRAGRWSTSMTWLAPRVRRAVGPDVRIGQVRYADSSWSRLDRGVADVRAALEAEAAGAPRPRRVVLVGLSMGGGTCLANADAPGVVGLVAMAPWFPREFPIDVLAGKRLRVVHGSLDNAIPVVPGTSRRESRAAVRRAAAAGADAQWIDLPLGLHGLAVRWRGRGQVVALPRARAFARVISTEVAALVRP
jgi:dienelactone hydrolase